MTEPPLEGAAPTEAHVLIDELWPLIEAQNADAVSWLRRTIERQLRRRPASRRPGTT